MWTLLRRGRHRLLTLTAVSQHMFPATLTAEPGGWAAMAAVFAYYSRTAGPSRRIRRHAVNLPYRLPYQLAESARSFLAARSARSVTSINFRVTRW
jgi:hypothetical protein